MGEVVDSVKYPSLPSNYITLQWLKEKQRKQQENEEKEQYPLRQNDNGKGLVGNESKLKEVRGNNNKKKKGYFVKRVERDMGKEEMMSVGNGGRESYKEVEEERNVDRGSEGERCGVGFRGKKNSWRKRVGKRVDVKDTTNEKVRMGGAFCAYGDKEVASGCMVEEVVGESKGDSMGQNCGVGFGGKKNSRRGMGSGVGEVSEKGDSVEQLGQECNAEKEKVSVDEKVKVSGTFRAYGDKEVEQVAMVCAVEVVGENKLGKKIAGQKCRVGFMGKKNSRRRMGNGVGQVSHKEESVEQSGHVHNAEKEEVSVDVKERTNEKVRLRGAFRAYGDKSIDVPLIDSEAGLKMKIERDLEDLSLSDRRYGQGRSSIGAYDNKWRCGNSRRYEPRKMLKQKDSSFMWIKKGESSNANVAEIETQVDFSSQSTSQSKLCSQ